MIVRVGIRKHTFVPSTVYDDVEGSMGPYRFKVRVHRFGPGREKSKCTCTVIRNGIQDEKVSCSHLLFLKQDFASLFINLLGEYRDANLAWCLVVIYSTLN